MAVRSVRNSMSTDMKTGLRTGLIWLLDNSAATQESHRPDASDASDLLGKSLNNAGVRTATRVGFPVVNDRKA